MREEGREVKEGEASRRDGRKGERRVGGREEAGREFK